MNDTEKDNKSDEDSEALEEEEVDPRIQGELEKLNQSTDNINRWETELEDSRQKFRAVLVEATVKLDEQVKKIGKAVEDSKPYWEARRAARQAQVEAQRATQEYQRAIEILRAAKETIALAEERLLEEDSRQFDSAWQEMLNHATQRVMEAEQSRTRTEIEHRETAAKYNTAISHMRQLEKKLKRTINKSRPYFELKAKYYLQLEQLKQRVDERQAKLTQAKAEYRTALRNLETISDEIHARRRLSAMGPRGRGVGAEDDGTATDDISNFKMESDGISMISVNFEDSCNGSPSEDDPETRSTCSMSSTSAPLDVPCPYTSSSSSSSSSYPLLSSSCPYPSSSSSSSSPLSLSVCPDLLQLPGSGSLEGLEQVSPVLGPRSECSGASSPDCEQERGERAEGAEVKPEPSNNSSQKSSHLEKSLRSLSLQTTDDNDTDTHPFSVTSNTAAVLLLNSV
ncbi:SH3 domain-binding protein 5 [Sinocyclocheilus grahami]|uniref:SH3 domain-binding protein 5 n=1 Tax=Sinocyclocheilus grahami TaxID=75366 RepID=A0A672L6P2_SINGR|nr:PREDICTED: SH3 domain-binding protein 5-like [Sinocyclocheilus grahami]